MMKDTAKGCAGRAEELLLRLDGGLELAAVERLERHVAGCDACRQLLAGLQSLDAALASRFAAPALAESFDRAVLARLDALPEVDPRTAVRNAELAEQDRVESLAGVKANLRRGISAGLLDMTGVGAILWAGGHLAPRLLDFVDQQAAVLPIAGHVGTAAAIAALAIVAAYLVARVERLTAIA